MKLVCAMVLVIDDTTLIDAKAAAHPYLASRTLVPGGYVVVWRPEADPSQYLIGAHYFGPFPGESEARDWLRFFIELRDACPGPEAGEAHVQPTAAASIRVTRTSRGM